MRYDFSDGASFKYPGLPPRLDRRLEKYWKEADHAQTACPRLCGCSPLLFGCLYEYLGLDCSVAYVIGFLASESRKKAIKTKKDILFPQGSLNILDMGSFLRVSLQ